MSYAEIYRQKLTTAENAVKCVKSGDWVDFGWCTGHPRVLDEALAARANELFDVNVRGGIYLWTPAIFQVENPADHFVWNSWHMTGIERKH
ncbi:MAG: butyryl-CoA:acetate CoA-transferase, partial [Oscillospiraceae bacterium]|nr:butyryl-CoA:acetate CoA-transferase [Oscillospiraceae bacterium]